MANGNGRMNGHGITVVIAILQVMVTLAGAGIFIRSVEKSFDERMDNLERKLDSHAATTKRNKMSFNLHHTIGVQCSRGCHIEKHAEFTYDKEASEASPKD